MTGPLAKEPRWLYDRRDVDEARADLAAWLRRWQAKYPRLTDWVEDSIETTWTFYCLPRQHHGHLKDTNMLERLNEGIRRRTQEMEELSAFHVATGFSGHGFGIGPGRKAVGDLVTGKDTGKARACTSFVSAASPTARACRPRPRRGDTRIRWECRFVERR